MRKTFCDRCGVEEGAGDKQPVKVAALYMDAVESLAEEHGIDDEGLIDDEGNLSLDLCDPCRAAVVSFALKAP